MISAWLIHAEPISRKVRRNRRLHIDVSLIDPNPDAKVRTVGIRAGRQIEWLGNLEFDSKRVKFFRSPAVQNPTAMSLFQNQPRRTFLRGLGTAVALPFLASAPAVRALGASAATAAAGKPPLRMAFVYIPNGALMKHWTPEETGSAFELPRILQPLAPVRDQISVLSGLAHDKARPNGDGTFE